jgi:hypothetical protein
MIAEIADASYCYHRRQKPFYDKVVMRLPQLCAIILPLALIASTPMHAQSTAGRARTTAGTHTAALETPQGTVRVHVASDAAAGDMISGAILLDPSGATPADREANLRRINTLTVEFQGQQTAVSSGRYEWRVPTTLNTGSAPLSLTDANGIVVSQSSVPIDPVPHPAARAGSPDETFDVPAEGETGRPAVIRGRFDRGLPGTAVTLGATMAEVLASSPRQLAFRVPDTTPGLTMIRFTSDARVVDREFRIFDVRLAASRTQLFRNQRAELTVTVRGLDGITQPVMLTLVNQSASIVRIDDIDRAITISPGQVKRGGTFAVTRKMTGIEPGPFQVSASVGKPPLAQFDIPRTVDRVLSDWQARTGVRIAMDAGDLIQRSVLGAGKQLDEFLSQQRAHQGDAQDVFAALLSHYCFDLRDEGMARKRVSGRLPLDVVIRPVALRQNRPATPEITSNEVRRLPFSDVLSGLVSRFSARQAVGYLFVKSMPSEAPITTDGQRRGELTDRRFVTPVGDHQIVVTAAKTCRERVTVNAFQTEVIDCGG